MQSWVSGPVNGVVFTVYSSNTYVGVSEVASKSRDTTRGALVGIQVGVSGCEFEEKSRHGVW
jgi:hypothetical protein